MLEFVNFYLVPGLVLGCIYALGAIGVSLLFGILRFAHFAHGDVMALGAYLALLVVRLTGLPAIAALPLAAVGAAVACVVIDRLAYRPFRERQTIVLVIASFGVALMLRSAIQLFGGVESTSYKAGIERPLVFLDTFRIAERHIWIVLGTVVLVVALHLFLSRSRTGKAMRAMSDERDLARVSGIDTERVVVWTWLIGGGLAAAAGVFLGMDTQLNPYMGWDLLLPVFAAAILGGIGRPYGAIAGGLVIGLAEELSTYPWLGGDALVSPDYKTAVAFAIMLAMLIWRPTGLFRGRVF
ncbi:MAG: branched-chain amino acid ABC transporter permease [Geminicoccaceae bacterium]